MLCFDNNNYYSDDNDKRMSERLHWSNRRRLCENVTELLKSEFSLEDLRVSPLVYP